MVKKEVESSEDEDLEVGLSNNLKQPTSTKITRANTKASEELESPVTKPATADEEGKEEVELKVEEVPESKERTPK